MLFTNDLDITSYVNENTPYKSLRNSNYNWTLRRIFGNFFSIVPNPLIERQLIHIPPSILLCEILKSLEMMCTFLYHEIYKHVEAEVHLKIEIF